MKLIEMKISITTDEDLTDKELEELSDFLENVLEIRIDNIKDYLKQDHPNLKVEVS